MRSLFPALIALAVAAACSPSAPPTPEKKAMVVTAEALPFIENDYPAALALAKERKLPLFIDVWAPW